jgi:hypothetical protein
MRNWRSRTQSIELEAWTLIFQGINLKLKMRLGHCILTGNNLVVIKPRDSGIGAQTLGAWNLELGHGTVQNWT